MLQIKLDFSHEKNFREFDSRRLKSVFFWRHILFISLPRILRFISLSEESL